MELVTLQTGRVVMKGLNPHTPEYRGRLLGKKSMAAPSSPPPSSCLQSGNYYLNMYGNDTWGDCTVVALVEIVNYVYGVQVDPNTAIAWARAHNALNGANELDILNSAETDPVVVGSNGYVIGPSSTLDYTSATSIQSAIYSHKAVYWGLDAGFLQKCVGNVSGWVAPVITTPQTDYDHAVFSPDYGTLDQCATYLNQQRGVTVTIGSMDPATPCVTLDTWDTLGIVPIVTIGNVSGEAHAIESFPAPVPAPAPGPAPTPTPGPTPQPPTRRAIALINRMAELYDQNPEIVHKMLGDFEFAARRF